MYGLYDPGQALDNPYQGVLGIFLGNPLGGEPITVFGLAETMRRARGEPAAKPASARSAAR